MSRSGYTDDGDLDNWALIKWRGQVISAMRGERGYKLLTELAAAMDAMPERALVKNAFEVEGQYCALGVVGAARGIDMSGLAPDDPEDDADTYEISKRFNIARALACEIMYINDDCWVDSPEKRWKRVRQWVTDSLKEIEAYRAKRTSGDNGSVK